MSDDLASDYGSVPESPIRPDIQAPTDPRGGFGFDPEFCLLTTLDGGFVNPATNDVMPGVRNEGNNP